MTMIKRPIEDQPIHMFPDGRLDTHNASLYLGLSEKTLAMLRCKGEGPQFIKCGRVFYFKDDLDRWVNRSGRFLSTTQALHAIQMNHDGRKQYDAPK